MLSVPDYDQAKYLLMTTRRGKIKRTLLEEYSSVRSNGLIAIGLDAGDELGWVTTTMGDEDVLLTTRMGKTLRFIQSHVRPMGRPASGVRGVALRFGDEVISMDVVTPEHMDTAQFITIGKNGKGKRTPLRLYPRKGRATYGVNTMILTDDDNVALARVIYHDMVLTFITSNGIILRTEASQIRVCGRAAQGVKVLELDENDTVVAMAADEPEDDSEKQKRILDIGDMIGVDMLELADDDGDDAQADDADSAE
jgi:DNA gyrase subunit A